MKNNDVFCVKVGCQKFYYLTSNGLLSELRKFINNPQNCEIKYFKCKKYTDRIFRDAEEELIPEGPPAPETPNNTKLNHGSDDLISSDERESR